MSKNPAVNCSRFDICSVNNCPLDPGYPNYDTSPLDLERKCLMRKYLRLRLGTDLPMKGMTEREWRKSCKKT